MSSVEAQMSNDEDTETGVERNYFIENRAGRYFRAPADFHLPAIDVRTAWQRWICGSTWVRDKSLNPLEPGNSITICPYRMLQHKDVPTEMKNRWTHYNYLMKHLESLCIQSNVWRRNVSDLRIANSMFEAIELLLPQYSYSRTRVRRRTFRVRPKQRSWRTVADLVCKEF